MAEVVATSATLRIFGDALDPREISERLGCLPTTSRRRGEMMGPKRNIVARTGGWMLCIEQEEGAQLEAQIGRLLRQTSDDLAVWRELARRFRVDVYCGIRLDEPGQGLGIAPDILRQLGERGIMLELDIYYPDGESDYPDDASAHPVAK